ncbi:hypothetical protein B6N60_03637 [Richelia sinica FACHB-800]|uniref:Uncharacterized protein n=1 Tax=Richelia sinica FACHB-800 TaxID=1357546 RepID=A0A975Y657_9NOST|nr:hypothetical protein [Richelia sinica]MBD2664027.1 hypothetical protein [Richelia sinica FACHB-800]QXE24927.1 hypothetical protein B6N60_03637 [Richelia sinica FACHB-800]
MLNNISQFISRHQLKLPVAGLVISLSVLNLSFLGVDNQQTKVLAAALENTAQSEQQSTHVALVKNVSELPNNTSNIPESFSNTFPEQDGTYLYGQSPKPNLLGQGYIVFQKQQNRVLGALYMPNSEFSCFQGTIAKSGELAMTVKSSPGEVGATEISTASRIPPLVDDESVSYAYSVTLKDYHRLNGLSDNDQQILQMCRQVK